MVTFDEEKQERKLEEFRSREEEDLARMLADKYGVQYINLSGIPINTNALRLIPEEYAREHHMAAFDLVDKDVHIAARVPSQDEVQEMLDKIRDEGYRPHLYIVSKNSLEKAWTRYKDISYATETKKGMLEISNEEVSKFIEEVHSKDEARKLIDEAMELNKGVRVTRIVEIIVATALSLKASDVHIEPKEDLVELRMRLDGVLVPLANFDHDTYKLLISRVKLLSGLKLNITDKGQDGRFTIDVKGNDIEVRTSVLPGNYGESIVMRILDPTRLVMDMTKLGMNKKLQKVIKRELERPNGVILNTGPTGSGKTTTLFAFLARINAPDVKIITIENPIEYHLEGVTQTQVSESEGYGFFEGLTSALRQDPDIIMVGEIRTDETAKTVIHAGLTGHLVFSTLHTNTAAGAFPRLIELGADPDIISSAVNVSMAQRLVRELCDDCKKERPITSEEKEIISNIFESMPEKEKYGDLWPTDTLWESTGCEECGDIGYRNRIGVFEAVVVDENIEKVLRETPTEREVQKAAKPQGIRTMTEDGIMKVLRGVTDLAELRRVIRVR